MFVTTSVSNKATTPRLTTINHPQHLTLGDQQHPPETPEAPEWPHETPSLPTKAQQQPGLMQQLGDQQQTVTSQTPRGPLMQKLLYNPEPTATC